jgi:hypothetical protein
MFRRSLLLGASALALLWGIGGPDRLHAQGRTRPGLRTPQIAPVRNQFNPLLAQLGTVRPHPGRFHPQFGCSDPRLLQQRGSACGRPGRGRGCGQNSGCGRSGRGRGCGQNGSGGIADGAADLTNVNVIEDSVGPYLQGAAEITRANAEYQAMIQDARMTREEANRSHLATRRAYIEQSEWERDRLPDPEKVRQEELLRALDRARATPPCPRSGRGSRSTPCWAASSPRGAGAATAPRCPWTRTRCSPST